MPARPLRFLYVVLGLVNISAREPCAWFSWQPAQDVRLSKGALTMPLPGEVENPNRLRTRDITFESDSAQMHAYLAEPSETGRYGRYRHP